MSLRKFIKICLVSFVLTFISLFGLITYLALNNGKTTAEKMVNSIVIVENSSGVVVYQDDEFALILTSAHVIDEAKGPILVKMFGYDDHGEFGLIPHVVEDFVSDPKVDLAILKVPFLDYSIIPAEVMSKRSQEPKIGDDVYIASNPHYHYRSLKKGILSSKVRMLNGGIRVWEVDAMIIFGSSGGGVFTTDGKLFGIVRGIDVLQTDHCWGIIDLKGKENTTCLFIPLTEIGYIVPPDIIYKFIMNSKFAEYF